MHETIRNARLDGEILLDGEDILSQDVTRLRRRVGMVFQKPNPFPKSIFENVAYGIRINGLAGYGKGSISDAVEQSLRRAALWDEVERRSAQVGVRPFRRTAAAPVHRAGPGGEPRSAVARRAVLGAGPDQHRQGGGIAVPPEGKLHAGDRHATTCSRPRASAIPRRSCCWAIWWSSAHAANVHTPKDPAPRLTSPAALDETAARPVKLRRREVGTAVAVRPWWMQETVLEENLWNAILKSI